MSGEQSDNSVSAKTTTKVTREAGNPILFITSDACEVRDFQDALEGHGFRLLWAESLQRAVEILRARRVRTVIIRHELHGGKGLACLALLRSDQSLHRTPVIYLTDSRDAALQRSVDQMRVYDYIVAPVDMAQLRRRIARSTTHSVH